MFACCVPSKHFAPSPVQAGGEKLRVGLASASDAFACQIGHAHVQVGVGVVGHLPSCSWAAELLSSCLLRLAAWAALLAIFLRKLISQMHAKFSQRANGPRRRRQHGQHSMHSECKCEYECECDSCLLLPFLWHSITKWRFLVNVCHSSYPEHVTPTSSRPMSTLTATSTTTSATLQTTKRPNNNSNEQTNMKTERQSSSFLTQRTGNTLAKKQTSKKDLK